jgi:molybdopterin synthase catalytic subunit
MNRFQMRLVDGPVKGHWAQDVLAGPDAGCTLMFFGTVRESGRLGEVVHLDYEAYPEMVKKEFAQIAQEAMQRFSVLRIAIEHSVGRVAVGECSVAVAIAATHRKDVFAAADHIMAELKTRVPLWKKEVCVDGSEWRGQGS